MEWTRKFKFVRETEGAIRYHEELPDGNLATYPNSPGATIGVLYIRKKALALSGDKQIPDRLIVTVATTG